VSRIKPKLYEVKTDAGALFRVRALGGKAAKKHVVEITTGTWAVRAIQDDEAYRLGQEQVEILDAVPKA
jgi:hypothetical protein